MADLYPIFMYHALWSSIENRGELESCWLSDPQLGDPGARLYALDQNVFRRQMEYISRLQLRTPEQWGDFRCLPDEPSCCITFDDGHLSNIMLALPILESVNLKAIFFITTDWINRKGFMDEDQILRLKSAGMLIGSHGCSHRCFSGMRTDELKREMQASKSRLEQILETEIPAIALPGGGNHPKLREVASGLGYRHVFTSNIGLAGPDSNPMSLPRIPITHRQPPLFLDRILEGGQDELRRMKRRSNRNRWLKILLGNRLYGRLRELVAKYKYR